MAHKAGNGPSLGCSLVALFSRIQDDVVCQKTRWEHGHSGRVVNEP